jgi:hypothetical protein
MILAFLAVSISAGLCSIEIVATAHGSPQNQQQDTSPQPTDERVAAMLKSFSPQLIELLVDANPDIDLEHIFRLLKIDALKSAPGKCNSGCSAETFDIEVPGEQSVKTTALRISFDGGKQYQYLIFKSGGPNRSAGWRFIGSFETGHQMEGPPRHRIESGNNRSWLVIRESLARSPSAKAFLETWHEIKENSVKRVLRYPVEGRVETCSTRTGRSFKSLLLRHELESGVYTIPVQFFVSFDILDCDKAGNEATLFTKSRRAFFIWDSDRKQFRFDHSRSELNEAEMESVYGLSELSNREFVEHNFDEISAIARSKNAEQKNWLRQFLTMLEEGPRKSALLKMLQH